MQAVHMNVRLMLVGIICLAAGPAMAANVFVGDKGGVTARDPPAIHKFLSTTGDQSQLVSGNGIWTDPLDMAADQTSGDVIVLDLGGAAATHPPRLLRYDGNSAHGRKSPWARPCGTIRWPFPWTAMATSSCSMAEGERSLSSPRCCGSTARPGSDRKSLQVTIFGTTPWTW